MLKHDFVYVYLKKIVNNFKCFANNLIISKKTVILKFEKSLPSPYILHSIN